MLGGVADVGGVGPDDVGEPGLQRLDHRLGVIDAEGGLGDIGQRRVGRHVQRRHVGEGGKQVNRRVDLADGPLHLRMAGVADQDHGAALAHIALGLGVDLGDQGAGGVQHRQPPRRRRPHHRLGHPVGAEHRVGAVGNLADLLDEDRALGLEVLDHMAVVDDLVAHIDRRLVLIQRPLHDLDRPHDAGAEAARLGQDHSHSRRSRWGGSGGAAPVGICAPRDGGGARGWIAGMGGLWSARWGLDHRPKRARRMCTDPRAVGRP